MEKQTWTPEKCHGCKALINAQTGVTTEDYEDESTTCLHGLDTEPDYHTSDHCNDKEV